MDEVNVLELDEDEKVLKHAGDAELATQKHRGGVFEDTDFNKEKAIGTLEKGSDYVHLRS